MRDLHGLSAQTQGTSEGAIVSNISSHIHHVASYLINCYSREPHNTINRHTINVTLIALPSFHNLPLKRLKSL